MTDYTRKLSEDDAALRAASVGLEKYTINQWTFDKSLQYLEKALAGEVPICQTRPTFAQPGDVYFYIFNFNESDLQHRSRFDTVFEDGFQFSATNNANKETGVVRVYSYLNDRELKNRLGNMAPKRYIDFHKATKNSTRTAVAVLYTGALGEAGQTPHGNSKHPDAQPFKRQPNTMKMKLANILKDGPSSRPKEIVKKVTYDLANLEGTSEQAKELLKPTLETAKRAKQKAKAASYISPDPLFSVYQLCHDGQIIHYYRLWPTFIVIFSSDHCLNLARELMNILRFRPDAPFQLAYDTTFQCGSFYLSSLVARNFLIEDAPLFPVILMMHDRRLTDTHTLLWDVFMKLCHKEFMAVAHLIPITVDREYAISKAIRFYCKDRAQITFCKLHLVKNFKTMLRRKRNFSQVKTTVAQYRAMCEAKSEEQYDLLLAQARQEWPPDVVKKFLDPNRGYDHPTRTKSAAFAVAHFTVFKSKPATNNVSESYNSMIKRLDITHQSRIDYIILQIIEDALFTISDMACAMKKKKSAAMYRLSKDFLEETQQLMAIFEPVTALPVQFTVDRVRTVWRSIVDARKTDDLELPSKEAALLRAVQCDVQLVNLDSGASFDVATLPNSITAIVKRLEGGDFRHLVQYHKGDLVCTCNMSKKCHHVYAVKILMDKKSIFNGKEDVLNPQHVQTRYMTRSRLSGAKGADPKPVKVFKTNLFPDPMESGRNASGEATFDHATSFMHTLELSTEVEDTDQELDDVSLFKTEFEDNYAADSHFPRHSTPVKHDLTMDISRVPSLKRPSSIVESVIISPRKNTCVKRPRMANRAFADWVDWRSHITNNELISDDRYLGLKPKQYLTQSLLDDLTSLLVHSVDEQTPDNNDQLSRHFLYIPSDIVSGIDGAKVAESHFFTHSPASKSFAVFYYLCDRSGSKGHWVVGIICFTSRRVLLLDSLSRGYHAESRKEVFSFAKRYIVMSHLFAGHREDMTKWQYIFSTDANQQVNGYDCGIYCFHVVYNLLNRVQQLSEPPESDSARSILHETLSLTSHEVLRQIHDAEVNGLENMHKTCLVDKRQIEEILSISLRQSFSKEFVRQQPTGTILKTLRNQETRGGEFWKVTCVGKQCQYSDYHDRPHIIRCVACKTCFHSDCYERFSGSVPSLCTAYFYCSCKAGPPFDYLPSPEKSFD
ncbi:hypothetical protein HDE_00925 [Halotydeus destructor]|nr:hypothetical protein HDE_00925 [Halotydeus destructor]